MLRNRIIPCLDVKNGRVVKGINFVDLKDAGDPVEQAKIYSDGGADEICFLDITASNENRDTIIDIVRKTAKECFVPLTVGGGIRNIQNITDDFMEPIRMSKNYLKDGDCLICFNFRPDRARQIIKSLSEKKFSDFKRKIFPNLDIVTFTQYDINLPVKVAFPPESLNNFIGQIVSENGLNQYRTAETEKYPHVTYFFNGGVEIPLPGEERYLIPSPRVATYDLEPEMSAEDLTISCSKAI